MNYYNVVSDYKNFIVWLVFAAQFALLNWVAFRFERRRMHRTKLTQEGTIFLTVLVTMLWWTLVAPILSHVFYLITFTPVLFLALFMANNGRGIPGRDYPGRTHPGWQWELRAVCREVCRLRTEMAPSNETISGFAIKYLGRAFFLLFIQLILFVFFFGPLVIIRHFWR